MYKIRIDDFIVNFITFEGLLSYLQIYNRKDTCSVIIPWSSTEPIVEIFQKIGELAYKIGNMHHIEEGLDIQLL